MRFIHTFDWRVLWARQIWSSGVSLKRSCKMQFTRVGLRSIGPSSQKLWPNQIFGWFPHFSAAATPLFLIYVIIHLLSFVYIIIIYMLSFVYIIFIWGVPSSCPSFPSQPTKGLPLSAAATPLGHSVRWKAFVTAWGNVVLTTTLHICTARLILVFYIMVFSHHGMQCHCLGERRTYHHITYLYG